MYKRYLLGLAILCATGLPLHAQAAQLWESYYTSFAGWPLPHDVFGGSCVQFPNLIGCNTLPVAYFDAFATNNTAQNIVTRVRLTGPYTSWSYAYNSAGSISVTSGTDVTLEWSCQDYQNQNTSYSGTCAEYWADNTCKRYTSQQQAQYAYYPYSRAEGSGFTATGPQGAVHVAPTVTTTYALRCDATVAPVPNGFQPGYGYGGITPPTTAWQNFTVTVTPNPPSDPCPTAIARPWDIWGYLLYASNLVRLNLGGSNNYCLQNNSGNHYFVPTKTQTELDSFYNALGRLNILRF